MRLYGGSCPIFIHFVSSGSNAVTYSLLCHCNDIKLNYPVLFKILFIYWGLCVVVITESGHAWGMLVTDTGNHGAC